MVVNNTAIIDWFDQKENAKPRIGLIIADKSSCGGSGDNSAFRPTA